jgi:hypothetical protein
MLRDCSFGMPPYNFVLSCPPGFAYLVAMRLFLEDLNLNAAERLLCVEALNAAGSIVEAAQLLGITRHALKRRIIKHRIEWPRSSSASASDSASASASAS